jgi:phosphoribosylformylglycinamidine (FGAM) synthase-like amidotransferase family enzyme
MRKLLHRWDLVKPIKALAKRGAPILGTCAGTKIPSAATLLPAIEISPLSGVSKPAINRSSVVFPDPEEPKTETNSLGAISIERF